jgi:AcrR family transcriptional regulator
MCPRTVEQVEQLKDERRRALLRAARSVFAKKGLAAAKISEIAAAAGFSYGLVYHYYPQKESLFAAVVQDSIHGWDEVLAAAQKEAGTPWDRLHYVCTQMIVGLHEEPDYLLIIVRALAEDDAPPQLRAALSEHIRQVREQLASLIEEGQRAGIVAAGPPMELARTVLALVQGLAISRAIDKESELPPSDMLLRFLKA